MINNKLVENRCHKEQPFIVVVSIEQKSYFAANYISFTIGI